MVIIAEEVLPEPAAGVGGAVPAPVPAGCSGYPYLVDICGLQACRLDVLLLGFVRREAGLDAARVELTVLKHEFAEGNALGVLRVVGEARQLPAKLPTLQSLCKRAICLLVA